MAETAVEAVKKELRDAFDRMIDILEQRGIVGPADGAKPREVYGAAVGVE